MIINQKYLKQFGPLPINYDLTEVMNYVNVAETIWVIPIIGQSLYDEIEEQVENNELSEENQALLTSGYLWQYLSFATAYESLPMIWAHLSEVGITLGKSDNSDSTSLKDITFVQQHLKAQTEALRNAVRNWLCERTDQFPLFDPSVCPGCSCSCGKPKAEANGNIYTTPRCRKEIE